MEYPGSKFTRKIRSTTLLMFISAFFLITPIVILYSAGYRFDYKNGLLLETGSLSVDVLPETATVYLDGLKIDQTLPIRLNNITPHKYTLKISASGYYDWEKQIEIKKNKTTYIKEFVLLRKSKPKLITSDTAVGLTLSSSGRYLAYLTTRNNETSVVIVDEKGENKNLIFKVPGAQFLRWAPNYDFLAISNIAKKGTRVRVIDAITGTITEVKSAYPILKYLWGDTTDPALYYDTEDGIYSYAPHYRQSSLITNKRFLDWYMSEDTLWTLDINTSTLELNVSKDSLGFKSVFSSFQTIGIEPTTTFEMSKFVAIEDGTVLLKDKSGTKFFIIRADKKFAIEANNYFFSKFNNWWIFWGPYELWTYSENDEPFLLNRSGKRIENIIPLDQFNTLALQRDDEISALFPYFYIDRSLVDDGVKAMAVNPNNRILYFTNDKGLWRLNY